MKIKPILIELGRIVLGLTFSLSGLLKGIDPAGVSIKVHDFQTQVFGISDRAILDLSSSVAFSLIILEFCTGAFLLMGIYRRLSTRIACLMLVFFTCTTGYTYLTGSMPDCGCFGDAIKLTASQTFYKNLILLPVSIFLVRYALQIKHLYSLREQWIPAWLSLIGISFFAYSNISALPFIDFRPYKIGTNIRERLHTSDSLYQEAIRATTRYIYEKDGVQQSFSVDSLPDETWKYVEVKQSDLLDITPPQSLLILTPDGEDKTDEILGDATGVFLFLSPDWTQASQEKYEVINELYRYLKTRNITLYSVSPTIADNAAEWVYRTGAEYPRLFIDATTIKTMIRSNPGLLVLKDGKVVDKLSSKDFPNSDEIANFVTSRLDKGEHITPSYWRVSPLFLWGLLLFIGFTRRILRWGRAVGYLNGKKIKNNKSNHN